MKKNGVTTDGSEETIGHGKGEAKGIPSNRRDRK